VSPCFTNGARSSITAQALLANSRQNKNHTAMTQSHAAMLARSLTPNMPPTALIFKFLIVPPSSRGFVCQEGQKTWKGKKKGQKKKTHTVRMGDQGARGDAGQGGIELMKEGAKEGGMGSVVTVLAQTVTGLQASHSSTGLPHSIIRSDDVHNGCIASPAS
jgi:hypothetical protein